MGLIERIHAPPSSTEAASPADAEPTLGALLRHHARTAIPARLYLLLQFGIPFALDFGLHGHYVAAVGGVAIAALGTWGLSDRWLFAAPERHDRRATLVRCLRFTSGTVAGGIAVLILLGIFLRLLGNAPIS
jgi:hypothetical protein